MLDAPTSTLEVKCAIEECTIRVRKRALRGVEMHAFFRTNLDRTCPADHWESLESLMFRAIGVYNESSTEHLVQWL